MSAFGLAVIWRIGAIQTRLNPSHHAVKETEVQADLVLGEGSPTPQCRRQDARLASLLQNVRETNAVEMPSSLPIRA